MTLSVLTSIDINSASAQLIPAGLKESIDELTAEMRDLKGVLNESTKSGNEMSSSIKKFYELADKNVPSITQSLHQAAESLDTLADFSTTVQDNTGKIAAAAVGSLALGIILGKILSDHIFVFDKDKNAVFKAINAGRAWYFKRSHPIRLEELSMPAV